VNDYLRHIFGFRGDNNPTNITICGSISVFEITSPKNLKAP